MYILLFTILSAAAAVQQKCILFFDWDDTIAQRGITGRRLDMKEMHRAKVEKYFKEYQEIFECDIYIITAGGAEDLKENRTAHNTISKSLLPDTHIKSLIDEFPYYHPSSENARSQIPELKFAVMEGTAI